MPVYPAAPPKALPKSGDNQHTQPKQIPFTPIIHKYAGYADCGESGMLAEQKYLKIGKESKSRCKVGMDPHAFMQNFMAFNRDTPYWYQKLEASPTQIRSLRAATGIQESKITKNSAKRKREDDHEGTLRRSESKMYKHFVSASI